MLWWNNVATLKRLQYNVATTPCDRKYVLREEPQVIKIIRTVQGEWAKLGYCELSYPLKIILTIL